LDWLDLIRHFLTGGNDRSFCHRLIVQVSQDLGGALQGNEVVLVQVYRLGFDLWPVLHRLGDSDWIFSRTHLAALGTALCFYTMLGHLDGHPRQVEDLSRLVAVGGHFSQRSPAMDTLPYSMNFDVMGMLHCLQRVPFVSRLTACLLATPFALAFRLWLLESIAGWWLAAVAAVLRFLVFQGLNPGHELVNDLLLLPQDSQRSTDQLCDQRDHAFFALQVSGVYLIPGRQF
jgi:hypothetical protein